tara:strand:- start:452 stop:1825 length:1374 start_codon:yes stop_codon:yes gene_type:complete
MYGKFVKVKKVFKLSYAFVIMKLGGSLMSNCQQCGKTNPPSKGRKPRKFCSRKCGKLSHYNRHKAEGRYYTKKNPNWGEQYRKDKERKRKNKEEWEKWSAIWLTRKQVAEELGISESALHHRLKRAQEKGAVETITLQDGNSLKDLINPDDVDKLKIDEECMRTPIPPEYVTAKEVAEMMGIKLTSFQTYKTRQGKRMKDLLPPYRKWKETHGNKVTKNLYLREKVEDFIKQRGERAEYRKKRTLEERLAAQKAKTKHEKKIEELITAKEAAQIIGRHTTTMNKYIKNGELPVAYSHGQAKYFHKEDIEAYASSLDKEKEYREMLRRKKNAAYMRMRRSDPIFKMKHHVSVLVYHAIVLRGGKSKGGVTFANLPYTPAELKQHIEDQFDKHMSWDNYGDYWHVDHIIPQAALVYDSFVHPNFKKCWALSNLRPLTREENASKGSLFEGKRHTYKKHS